MTRLLAGATGGALAAVEPGQYRVRVNAIGHESTLSGLVAARSGVVTTVRLVLRERPLVLDEIVVAGSPVCEFDVGGGTLLARLWQEARTNLESTQLTRSSGLELEMTGFERDLTASGVILTEQVSSRRGSSLQPVVAAAGEIERNGFVAKHGRQYVYYAPDERFLLSDHFVRTHCFSVAGAPLDTTLVGLRFEPVRQRALPEISGVLWLRHQTAELVRLDFTYVNLELPAEAEGVGGRVGFRRLSSGASLIGDWLIRMPRIVSIRGVGWSRDSLAGYREVGGSVIASRDVVKHDDAQVVGVVYDSITGGGISGAIVSLSDGAYADTTDNAGLFRIDVPLQGPFRVSFTHPRIEQLRLAPLYRAASLIGGATTSIHVALPGTRATLDRLCAADSTLSNKSLILGQVLDPAGLPIVAHAVRAWWDLVEVTGPRIGVRPIEVTVVTDQRGHFQVCAPLGRSVTIRSDRGANPIVLGSQRDSVSFVTIRVQRGAAVTVQSVVLGRVSSADGPVNGAEVLVAQHSLRVVTGERGEFTLVVPEGGGLVRVVARAVGFYPATKRIAAAGADTVRMDFLLDPVPQQLDSVTVTAEGYSVSPRMRSFEERRKAGFGRFLTRKDLATREHSTVGDVIRMTPGVSLVRRPSACGGGYAVATGRGGATRREDWMSCGRSVGFPAACYYAIVLDGARYWVPGSTEPPDIDQFKVNGLEAIEIYRGPSEVPTQYQTARATCGLVVFWTRDGRN